MIIITRVSLWRLNSSGFEVVRNTIVAGMFKLIFLVSQSIGLATECLYNGEIQASPIQFGAWIDLLLYHSI